MKEKKHIMTSEVANALDTCTRYAFCAILDWNGSGLH